MGYSLRSKEQSSKLSDLTLLMYLKGGCRPISFCLFKYKTPYQMWYFLILSYLQAINLILLSFPVTDILR